MKKTLLFLTLLGFAGSLLADENAWDSKRLLPHFHAEGAAVGDLNGDGKADIAYGPFWFAGPDFAEPIRFTTGEPFIAEKGYSDNFFSYITDANGDGKNDVLVYGFPGKEARLYVNPGSDKAGEHWPMHIVANEISNESPTFVDLIPGGLPEMVTTHNTSYGYYEAGEDATQPWKWHAISPEKEAGGRFEHGLGVGDVNGDGRLDIIQKQIWYEHPEELNSGNWKKHGWSPVPSRGGAQILVDDFDCDGDSDLVSSLWAHGFGLAWFEQVEPGKFARHDLMGESSTDNPYGVCFSQLHALALADMDGDGRKDFVTGKRYLAHQGKDQGGLQEPVLYWFRNTKTEDGIEFVPHLVHRDSGVGVEITVADLNGDGKPDIISGNKKGLTIHLQKADGKSAGADRWKTPGGKPQDGYGSGLSPEEALAKTEVPEGFSVDLVAAEPDITQPIAMCFDARGRIWVLEGHTYPVRAEEGKGKDRIVILEDSDANGSFETRKIFIEGLNLASGIEVGFGGVYVGAAPYFLFIADKDEDDKPDGEPEILLDGWGYQDTHETLNAFTWGPDGWLYGCHGVFTHSNVGKPGAPDEERTKLNAGVWRYHPIRHEFEVYAHGTSNPWGVDFNEVGDWFISACVIPHFYHLSQGGRYQRQGGQHFNPYTFDDIKTIADHSHFAGNIRDHAFWGGKRPVPPSDTSALGGGHAHCGLAFYQAKEFPASYRGDFFFHNLHGHRIVRERVEGDGSGYTARHRPDFVLSNNHDFVGVGVMQGPDGAMYYSDWVDPQTCHHRDVEIWDRKNGRIFRVRYGEVKSKNVDLRSEGELGLLANLIQPNAFLARQAQLVLQERAARGELSDNGKNLRRMIAEIRANRWVQSTPQRLRFFWTEHVCGLLETEHYLGMLEDSDEHVRGWAIQFLGEKREALPEDVLTALEKLAVEETSLVTRRYLASLLQRIPLDQRWKIAEGLIGHHRSINDRNIPLLCWYGIEPLMDADGARTLSLADKTPWPILKDFLSRRGVITPEGRDAIMTSLSGMKNPDLFANTANQFLAALSKLPPVDPPKGWEAAKNRGEKLAEQKPAVRDPLSRLGVRFGDADFFPRWRAIAANKQAKVTDRIKALELLTIGNDPELGELARESLNFPAMRTAAIAALRNHPGPETAEALVSRLGQLQLKQRNAAINLLASRPEMALAVLEAVDQKEVEASLISPVMLDQFDRFENEKINQLVARNWVRGNAGIDLAQLAAAIENWTKKLNPQVLAKADASRGRQTFQVTCGACHQLFGEGIAMGPDLTGSNRSDLAYLLENALAPSAVVGKDYLLQVFKMKGGSTVSGMIREQTPEFIKVGMAGGATADVKVADIAEREELAQSLMPPGLFEALPLNQVADLVKYLGSPNQVPLPGQGGATDVKASAVPPPAKGVVRIEGESLVPKFKPSGGELKDQPMSGFGPMWSGNRHLWWTGGQPDDVLTLKLNGVEPGTKNLTLFTTTAKDYAQIKVAINGQLREVDLFTEQVLPGEPLRFENVNISPSEPLQIDIHITGKNEAAVPNFMVGIDRIEVETAKKPASD